MKQTIFKILRIVRNILFWFMLITYIPLAYLLFDALIYIAHTDHLDEEELMQAKYE